ncbi:MAG TPA: anaerobic sulfatase maturase [Pararhizobium sp.]|uniref:anaerobic sulfatase maturase n=1 Tax=Pararhizobium sp. TaxID=1977563 RepID=UPI002C08B5B9|nr:anaerobic sulfatase maturase [Pararhizobium sp.]HTO33158.1 anaerobic sulfatase maturase [Pararhizobium sp.]
MDDLTPPNNQGPDPLGRRPRIAAFHLMAKPGGATCNIDCDYCFFLSKERLYPDSRTRMSEATLESYIRQLLETHPNGEVNIAWQGGEPTLLGLDFFARAIDLAMRFKRPGQVISHSIQTNGLLLDDQWCAFLMKNGILVGLSLDGPRAFHDFYRKDKRGRGTFDLVAKAVRNLRRHGVDFNILCTVNAANQDHGRTIYRYFRDTIKAEWIQFIPIVERSSPEGLDFANAGWPDKQGKRSRPLYTQSGDRAGIRSVDGKAYGKFLIAVYDEWIANDVSRVHVQMFEAMLAAFFGHYLTCTHAPACGRNPALEHNGDLYCCDHYVEPGYRLGNINMTPLHTLLTDPRLAAFGNDKFDTLTAQCLKCEVRAFCNGGCPKGRFAKTHDGQDGHNYLCEGLHAFYSHALPSMRVIASLVASGRPATAVTE